MKIIPIWRTVEKEMAKEGRVADANVDLTIPRDVFEKSKRNPYLKSGYFNYWKNALGKYFKK